MSPPGCLPVGVARYVRLDDEPTSAEVAVTVGDSQQGRGVGTMLLGVLSRSASDNGISIFVAFVLEGNERVLRIFRQSGARIEMDSLETLLFFQGTRLDRSHGDVLMSLLLVLREGASSLMRDAVASRPLWDIELGGANVGFRITGRSVSPDERLGC